MPSRNQRQHFGIANVKIIFLSILFVNWGVLWSCVPLWYQYHGRRKQWRSDHSVRKQCQGRGQSHTRFPPTRVPSALAMPNNRNLMSHPVIVGANGNRRQTSEHKARCSKWMSKNDWLFVPPIILSVVKSFVSISAWWLDRTNTSVSSPMTTVTYLVEV